MKKLLILLAASLLTINGNGQEKKNLAELLGYPKESKLLIIHADDMGLSNSVNRATIKAFDEKGITSGSIMMPCPWADDICFFLKDRTGYDVGIHLTMTAEWKLYKWGGLTSSDQIPSLLDRNGYFYATVEDLGRVAKGEEAMKELKGQIDRAIALGVKPTHIDTHMGSVLANPELVQVYLMLAETYRLPILFPRSYLGSLPAEVSKMLGEKIYLLDNMFMLDPSMLSNSSWMETYKKGVQSLKPGLNQIIVHLGYDNEEMRAICTGHEDFGSAWRQHDLDLVNSKEFKDLLKENNIILIGWAQIRDAMK